MCVCVSSGRAVGRRESSVHGVLIHIRAQAEEDASPQHEDGGSPAEAVAPVELVVGLEDRPIDELDREEHQRAGLQDHCNQTGDADVSSVRNSTLCRCLHSSKHQSPKMSSNANFKTLFSLHGEKKQCSAPAAAPAPL